MTPITELPALVGKKVRKFIPQTVLHQPGVSKGFDNLTDNPAHEPVYIGNLNGVGHVFYLNATTGLIQQMRIDEARWFDADDSSDPNGYPKS